MFPIPLGWLKKSLLVTVAFVASVYVAPVQAEHSADETLLSAMQLVPDSLQAKKTKTVLYLGGGERSPWFHLGVLYALEEYKIPVDSIVATSWGAWMGALWSLGVSIDDIQRLMLDSYIADYMQRRNMTRLSSRSHWMAFLRSVRDFRSMPIRLGVFIGACMRLSLIPLPLNVRFLASVLKNPFTASMGLSVYPLRFSRAIALWKIHRMQIL